MLFWESPVRHLSLVILEMHTELIRAPFRGTYRILLFLRRIFYRIVCFGFKFFIFLIIKEGLMGRITYLLLLTKAGILIILIELTYLHICILPNFPI